VETCPEIGLFGESRLLKLVFVVIELGSAGGSQVVGGDLGAKKRNTSFGEGNYSIRTFSPVRRRNK